MYKIVCDFGICAFNEDGLCCSKRIRVDAMGMCENALLPDFSDEILKESKEKAIEKLKRFES